MIDSEFAFGAMIVLGAPIVFIINLLRKKKLTYHLVSILAFVYGAGVISVTLFPLFLHPSSFAHINGIRFSYNLIPFDSIMGSINHFYYLVFIRNVIGNVVLLLPLGILLGICGVKRTGRVFLYGFGVSLGIELLQLAQSMLSVAWRSADVDDLILNSTGAVLGFLVYRTIQRLLKNAGSRRDALSIGDRR